MGTRNLKEGKNKHGIYFRSEKVIWNIGVYIRLSVADDLDDVSLSVQNQKAIIQRFLETEFNEPYKLYQLYIDDGISGTTNDERPSFTKMIQDIDRGKINCVIAKMLSRCFRNYADQGYFLEEFFPRMGVRFITLESPKVDTFKNPEMIHGYELPLNGIVNDRIAEAASVAVRQTFQNMRREGKFQGGFPPYGYKRNPEDKHSFIIDEPAANIVQKIYHWFVFERMGLEGIRKRLNELSIPNPTGYKAAAGCKYHNPGIRGKESYAWGATTVKAILQNRTYLGEMVQGKMTIISYKVHKQIQVPQEQWSCVPDRHTPIIEKEVFEKAQELLQLNKSMKNYNSSPALLSGFLYCADCKRKMHKRKNGDRVYYSCSTYYKRNKNDCTPHFTKAKLIEKAVLEAIQMQISFVNVDDLFESIFSSEEEAYCKKRKAECQFIENEIHKIDLQMSNLYLDYNQRLISTEEYLHFKEQFQMKQQSLKENLVSLNEGTAENEKKRLEINKWLEIFKKHKNITELNRQVLEELVDKIYVDQEKNIMIQFKYADLFKGYL